MATPSLSATWMTELLRAAGTLPHGRVLTVQEEANTAFNSRSAHLVARYSADAPPDAPRAIFLKRNLAAEWAVRAGRRELAFYRFVAPLAADLPMIVPFLGGWEDPARGATAIALADVTATHHPPLSREQSITGQSVPTFKDLERVVTALADLHAAFWEHPQLGDPAIPADPDLSTAARFAATMARLSDEWARFLAAEGATIPAEYHAIGEASLRGLPIAWERHIRPRFATRRQLSLIHGDAYFSNSLVPRPGATGPTYLIDFQSPATGIAAQDLVNLLATFWTPAQRNATYLEQRALRLYYNRLVERGVSDYEFADLERDYRLMVLCFMRVPIWDQTNGSDRAYWWPKLFNLFAAYQELDVAALFAAAPVGDVEPASG